MKILDYIIIILFILFGITQFNDPDFYLWIPVYFVVAMLGIFKVRNIPYKKLAWFATAVIFVWLISYIPSLIDWIDLGMPTIAGSMKAETPHVEFTREFFGLLLCLLACIYFLSSLKSS